MARPQKVGLDYYPKDTDILSDRKIKRLLQEFGLKGYMIFDCLLCLIYRNNGYWVQCDDELYFDISDATKNGVTEQLVKEVINGCVRYGLFDERLFNMSNILTSSGIQKRYLLAKRNGVIAAEMAVITVKTPVIAAETPVITAISTQSKVKESKVNKSKENKDAYASSKTEVSGQQDILKNLYQDVPKNKKEVYSFIRDNRPAFIEPYIDLWNIWADEYRKPKVSLPTKSRRRHFATRIREPAFDFPNILKMAKDSPYVMQPNNWFNFDWVIKSEDNYTKLLDGNYKQAVKESKDKHPEQYDEATDKLLQIFNERNNQQ